VLDVAQCHAPRSTSFDLTAPTKAHIRRGLFLVSGSALIRRTVLPLFPERFSRGDDALQHGWQEKEVDQRRIELRPAALGDDLGRCLEALSSLVRASMADDVEGVGDGDDACRQRNTFSAQLSRVAGTIPPLVVR